MKSKRSSVSPLLALLLAAAAVAEAQSSADSALAEGVASLAGGVARAQREAAGPDAPVTMPQTPMVARKAPAELPALSGSLEDGAGASVKLPTPEEAKAAAEEAKAAAEKGVADAEAALAEARSAKDAADAKVAEARAAAEQAEEALDAAERAARDALRASGDSEDSTDAALESASAVTALDEAKRALAEAEDAVVSAKAARDEADRKVDEAEDAVDAARDEARRATRAVRTAAKDAEQAAKDAARNNLAAAERALDEARAAQDAAERVYLFAEAVENRDADEKSSAEAAAQAAGALAEAEEAAKAAEAKAAEAGDALDEAERALSAADRALRDAREAVEDADEASAEQASSAEQAAEEAAAAARTAYDEADRAFAEARGAAEDAAAGLDAARRDAKAKSDAAAGVQARIDELRRAAGLEPGAEVPSLRSAEAEMDAADEDFYQARNAYNAARAEYDRQFPNRHVAHVADLSADEATEVLAPYEAARRITFVGDRLWLAGTEIDGRPLADSFRRGGGLDDAIADARTRAVNGGFYLAGFQALDGGRILVDKGRIHSVTARIVDANGTNGTFFSESQILRRFASGRAATAISNEAENGSLFDFSSVGARFQALNGHPDVKKADIVFTPAPSDWIYVCDDGVTTNAARGVDMAVTVTENPGVLGGMHGVLGIDNYGSMRGSDQWMARGTVQWLNLWQLDHALTLNANASLGGSLWGLAGSYFVPRSGLDRWYDFSWTLHGGYTHVDEKDVVPTIDVEGMGWFTGLQASRRLADSGRSTLDLSLGLTYRYVESALVLNDRKYDMGRNGEGYEILPLSLALIYTDSTLDSWGGRNYATLEGVYNVGVSGADDLKWYRTAIDDENYALLRAQLARIQLLGDFDARDASGLWMLFAKFDSQWASGPIVGAEQFGVGGHASVRGYEEREFMGDSGFTGTLELRTPILVGLLDHALGLFESGDASGFGWDRLQFIGFADVGWYQLKEALANGEDDDRFLAGAGLGLRMAASESATLSFDWGFPIVYKKEFDTSRNGVGHLSLQFQF